jgi:hypothetical protein
MHGELGRGRRRLHGRIILKWISKKYVGCENVTIFIWPGENSCELGKLSGEILD